MPPPPVSNPALPYVGHIGPAYPGFLVRIQGSTGPNPRCFAINLQCGPCINPRDDLALHLSPVFSPPPRVVRNSLRNGQWGPEESHGPYFPLSANQHFEILILTETDQFKIAINGVHFTDFRHRISIHEISHLSIDGDVHIRQIIFEDSGQGLPTAPSMPAVSGGAACPYPTGPAGMPVPDNTVSPYSGPPPMGGPAMAPYPSLGQQPYSPMGYQAPPAYGPQSPYPSMPGSSGGGGGYPVPPQVGVAPGPYGAPSAAGYPQQSGPYPKQQGGPYPTQHGYGPQGYPHSSSSGSGLLSGLTGAAAAIGAGSLASNLLGGHKGHKKSSPIPIGGVAAGLGAAALGAAVLHKPMKKIKKLFF
ncbi:uncharacterized protein LOC141852508 isoform X2 [Brevipalpus obovatus]|uniref:uncharacterized protein LOC141852508 isoform X2 n=1 Tax=Brevipalpus obovatus TaxID=246614 RepID=UPI003D9EB263